MGILHKEEVEIFLQGGLGNQLFGWAAGVSLAKRLECSLTLNTSQLSTRCLAIPKQILFETQISQKKSIYYKLNSKLIKRVYRNFPCNRMYFERGYKFENRFADITEPVTLHCYFQSRDYFKEYYSEILELLNDEKNLTQDWKKVRARLPDRFIAVHFRRGDYVQNSDFHPLISKQYYESSLTYLLSLGINSKRVIFTDDATLAREVFPNEIILTQDDLIAPFDTMYLMSKGEAIIGANSSFSLWAGFLLSAKGGACVFPSLWFGRGVLDNLSPVPPDFVRI